MIGGKRKNITTLYRVIDASELAALQALHFRKFPACAEPVFYPTLTRHFALETLRQTAGISTQKGYLTCFKICARYVRDFEVQTLSGEIHDELWVPAEELPVFNEKIVGRISLLGL